MKLKYIGKDEERVLMTGEVYEVAMKSLRTYIWVDIWYVTKGGRYTCVSRCYESPQELAANWCLP